MRGRGRETLEDASSQGSIVMRVRGNAEAGTERIGAIGWNGGKSTERVDGEDGQGWPEVNRRE